MSDKKPKNDRGPLTLKVRPELGDRILRRCHDDGVNANEATELLWERQLRRDGSIVGEDTPELVADDKKPCSPQQGEEETTS